MQIVHGPDLESLLDDLGHRLATSLDDPFAMEIVVVPAADMTNHLKRRLGSVLGDGGAGNGVVANVDFIYPRELINATLDQPVYLSGSPWDARRLSWKIAATIRESGLEDDVPGFSRRPLRTARRIADLFDRYASHRPEMLDKWRNDMPYPNVRKDGGQDWQRRLFRIVADALDSMPEGRRAITATDVHREIVRTAAARGALPRRVTVFGVDGLTRATRQILRTMSVDGGIDVAVYVVHTLGVEVPSIAVGVDAPSPLGHWVSARWGRQMHEAFAATCDDLADSAVLRHVPSITSRLTSTSTSTSTSMMPSLLERIQTGIATDASPARLRLDDRARAAVLRNGDGSLQVHGCYGATRQAEALRDALLHRLNDDPTLRLRDIAILCGDTTAAAPVLKAVLDPADSAGLPRLPINVLRSRATNVDPVVEAFSAVLGTLSGRCTAADILDLAALEPIAETFGFDADALDRLSEWTTALGVGFGLDGEHRSRWNVPASIDNGTWDLALRRLVGGLAVAAVDDVVGPGGIVPYGDLGGSDFRIVGALAEFLTRIGELIRRIPRARGGDDDVDVTGNGVVAGREMLAVGEWCAVMRDALDQFVTVAPRDDEARLLIHRTIDDIGRESDLVGDAAFSVSDLMMLSGEYFGDGFALYSTRAEAITVAGLGELRHIPRRVIAVFGADEAAFVGSRPDGDDVLAVVPQSGEPIYSLHGRQALLDALMAARETLIVTCNGANIANNKEMSFAVPVEDLLDLAADTLGSDANGGHAVAFRHPRHNFDQRMLEHGHVRTDSAYTFDPAAAVALQTVLRRRANVAAGTVPGGGPRTVGLPGPISGPHDLRTLLEHPIEYFYGEILGANIPSLGSTSHDTTIDSDGTITLVLNSLDTYKEGQSLLQARRRPSNAVGEKVRFVRPTAAPPSRLTTGLLPPNRIGELTLTELENEIDSMFELLPFDLRTAPTTTLACPLWTVPLGVPTTSINVDGLVLDRTVRLADGRTPTDALIHIDFRRYKEVHLLGLWVDLALVTAARHGAAMTGHLVRRGEPGGKPPVLRSMELVGADEQGRLATARRILTMVGALHRAASVGVVPLFPSVSMDLGRNPQSVRSAKIAEQFDNDKDGDPVIGFVFGDHGWDEVSGVLATDDDYALLGTGRPAKPESRAVLWARSLWGTFDATWTTPDDDGVPR